MKHLNTLNFFLIGLGIMFLWMGYMAYLQHEPFKEPTLNRTPFKILTEEVKQGGTLTYELDYCIYEKVPTSNSRTIVAIGATQRVYFLATTFSPGSKGCGKAIVSFPLSNDIPPGKYKVVSVGKYQVNKIKSITKTFESEEFTIK